MSVDNDPRAEALWYFNEAVSMLREVVTEGSVRGLRAEITEMLPAATEALKAFAAVDAVNLPPQYEQVGWRWRYVVDGHVGDWSYRETLGVVGLTDVEKQPVFVRVFDEETR